MLICLFERDFISADSVLTTPLFCRTTGELLQEYKGHACKVYPDIYSVASLWVSFLQFLCYKFSGWIMHELIFYPAAVSSLFLLFSDLLGGLL